MGGSGCSCPNSVVSFHLCSVDVLARFAVHLLFVEVHNSICSFVGGLKVHKRHFLSRIGEAVVELFQVGVCKSTRPIDHVRVLVLEALVLTIQFLVLAIKLKETSQVLRVLRQLRVSEEVQPLLAGFRYKCELLFSVAMRICIVLFCAFFQAVNLRGSLTHCNDFFDAALGISACQIALTQQERHHVVELRLWV